MMFNKVFNRLVNHSRYSSLILILIVCWGCQSQTKEFYFGNDRIGKFAESFFMTMNENDQNYLESYLSNNEDMRDFVPFIIKHAQEVNGITPYLLSFKTNDYISIYSKENNGQWVKVNLGLAENGIIHDLSIKKSYMPVDYDLREDISKNEINNLLKSIIEELKSNYVEVENRDSLSAIILNKSLKGSYDTLNQGDWLAKVLTNDLVSIFQDKHLQIISPAEKEQVRRRFRNDDTSIDNNPSDESGFSSELISNNIGLLKMKRFIDTDEFYVNINSALEKMKACQALIIDLRSTGGGDAAAMAHLLSYFFEDKKFVSKIRDSNNEVAELYTKPKLLSKTFSKMPLYILTSSKTISAGEGFAYHLKNERATLVGEVTAGAGYMVDVFELPYGFYLVNSIFSPYGVGGAEGWQNQGVIPDYKVSSSEALEKVLIMIGNSE